MGGRTGKTRIPGTLPDRVSVASTQALAEAPGCSPHAEFPIRAEAMPRGKHGLITRINDHWPPAARPGDPCRNRQPWSAIATMVCSRRCVNREHDRIMPVPVEQQSLPPDAFARRSDTLGDSLAGDVANGSDDLDAVDVGLLKRPVQEQTHRTGGDSLAPLGQPQPVAEVGRSMQRIDLVDSAAAQESARRHLRSQNCTRCGRPTAADCDSTHVLASSSV
jgi:hypothetical protein